MIVDDYKTIAENHDRLFGTTEPTPTELEIAIVKTMNTEIVLYEFTEDEIRDLLAA